MQVRHRAESGRNGKKWTVSDHQLLLEKRDEGWTREQMSAYFERTLAAIDTRITLVNRIERGGPVVHKGRDWLTTEERRGMGTDTRPICVPANDPLLARLAKYHGGDGVVRDVDEPRGVPMVFRGTPNILRVSPLADA